MYGQRWTTRLTIEKLSCAVHAGLLTGLFLSFITQRLLRINWWGGGGEAKKRRFGFECLDSSLFRTNGQLLAEFWGRCRKDAEKRIEQKSGERMEG